MSDRNDVPRTWSSLNVPAVTDSNDPFQKRNEVVAEAPPPAVAEPAPEPVVPEELPPQTPEDEARGRITALEREAKAMGADPTSALLFHEIGLLWEGPLKNPRSAAVAYQNAYRLAPRFLANIRAARRLFSEVGNWQMVTQLIDAELAASEDETEKTALVFDKAVILEERLSRESDAAVLFQQCLEQKPQDVSLLIQLEAVFAGRAQYPALVEVYRLLAAALQEDALKAHYLTSAGLLLDDRLGRTAEASACFREAFAVDRKDPLLLSAMMRIAERDRNDEELLSALAAEAEMLGVQSAPSYLRISKVYERLGRPEDALAALLAARRLNPTEPLILSELAAIYQTRGRHQELSEVLTAWADSMSDGGEMISLNLRLAALYEEDLKRDADAIARYRVVLSRVPNHAAALAGLGKLYHRTADWEGLLSVFDAELAVSDDAKIKAAKMYKAAEVLEERLGRQEEAIARYNQCLQLQPGYLPAQKALTRLYERQNRYADLVGMLEQDLTQTTDRDQSLVLLNRIASLYEERLREPERAIDCMKRILDLDPDHLPTIRTLSRLYEQAGQWRELILHHETEARLLGDTKQILSTYHRNAEILEEQLKDSAGAIAAYEKVLALSPSYLPALRSLGRLYAQDGRWNELIQMYRKEAETSASPEVAANLIYKIGELYEHRLRSEDEAIAAYQEVLTLAPQSFPALRALGRIYRGQQAWESLIDVLRSEAANRNDPTERANALFQAAAIWEDALKRDDMAVEVYEEVLRLMPAHVPSIRALERLYGSKGNVKELVTVLDREAQSAKTPNAQLAARLKLARMYLDRLNEPARAAQYCEAALAIDPENLFALKTLERLRATDRTRRSELKLRLSDKVADGRLRAALKLSAALDGDGANAGQASEDLKRAFDEDPNDSRLAFALERVLRQTGDDAGLAAFYERRLEGLEDVQEKLELTLRVADLAEVRNGDLRKALGCFRRATELMPNFLPAITGVRRVALKLGDFAAAREAWEAEARATRDVRSAIDAYVAAARLCAGPLKDADSAIANYRKALERDPLDASATAGLEGLLAQRGGSEDLALLHEKRGEAKLAQKDLIAASQAFFSAAKLWLGEGKGERAVAAVDRALSAQPSYGDALELKGELCLKAGQYAEAAAAYSVRVQQGGNAQVLARLHRLLGSIYHDHLSDLTRATAHLQTALSGNSADVEALERLASIHTLSRNWTGAADCLKRLLELVKEPEALARHTLALAQIFDQGFADPAQASALYRRALELVPGDASVIERLADLYQRMGNLPELIQMLEKQAVMTEDKARALALRLKIGDLYAKSLQSPQQAVASYKQAVQLDPSSVAAHVALADLYGRDAAAAPLAIDEHRTLLKLDPTRVESLHVLFRIWEGLRQPDRAYAVAGVLQFLRAATETEIAFYSEARNALPAELPKPLGFGELDLLMHPHARNPAVEILRAVGDQLTRIYPPDFESMGVDRKNDKLRTDHAAYRAIKAMAQSVGVEDFDVYLSRGSTLTLETSEPLGVCIGQEVVRKFSAREQRFLIGRAVFGLFNRAAVIGKISEAELANLIGNSVRIYEPYYDGMGERNEELTKQLRKAYSRKALKALEAPSRSLMATKVDLATTVKGLHASHHRAGLLLCGDVAAGLNALLRDDPQSASLRIEGTDSVVHALRQRPDLQDLMAYALSDEFFSVRQKVGVAIQKG